MMRTAISARFAAMTVEKNVLSSTSEVEPVVVLSLTTSFSMVARKLNCVVVRWVGVAARSVAKESTKF
jgi:hypothetical protein